MADRYSSTIASTVNEPVESKSSNSEGADKPKLKELVEQIAELDQHEREELAFALASEVLPIHPHLGWLSHRYASEYPSIVATPNVCGGEARLIRTRIPVWTIERMRQLGVSEIDILRSFPTLKAIDLVQVWSYVARHHHEIENTIRAHEED